MQLRGRRPRRRLPVRCTVAGHQPRRRGRGTHVVSSRRLYAQHVRHGEPGGLRLLGCRDDAVRPEPHRPDGRRARRRRSLQCRLLLRDARWHLAPRRVARGRQLRQLQSDRCQPGRGGPDPGASQWRRLYRDRLHPVALVENRAGAHARTWRRPGARVDRPRRRLVDRPVDTGRCRHPAPRIVPGARGGRGVGGLGAPPVPRA